MSNIERGPSEMATDNSEVQYNTISQGDWDSFPDPHVKPVSQWEDVLAALQAGEIVLLNYTDKRDKLSKRISIARQAHARGFRTQMRYTDSTMAIRRVPEGTPMTAPVATGTGRGRGRGRGRRNQQEAAEGNLSGVAVDLHPGTHEDSSDMSETLE